MKMNFIKYTLLVISFTFLTQCGGSSTGFLKRPAQYKCGSNFAAFGNMTAICVPTASTDKESITVKFNYRCGSNDYKIEQELVLGKRKNFTKNCYEAGTARFEFDYRIINNVPTLKMKSRLKSH